MSIIIINTPCARYDNRHVGTWMKVLFMGNLNIWSPYSLNEVLIYRSCCAGIVQIPQRLLSFRYWSTKEKWQRTPTGILWPINTQETMVFILSRFTKATVSLVIRIEREREVDWNISYQLKKNTKPICVWWQMHIYLLMSNISIQNYQQGNSYWSFYFV